MQNFYLIVTVILLGYILYKKFDFIGNKNVKSVSAEEAYKLIKENHHDFKKAWDNANKSVYNNNISKTS